MHVKRTKAGFTLIELLLVIGIIGILASIVIVAINPTSQLGKAFNVSNNSKKNEVRKSLQQYLIDNGQFPNTISTTPQIICSQDQLSVDCIDLSTELAPTYITQIPQLQDAAPPSSGLRTYIDGSFIVVDTYTGSITGYYARFDGSNDYVYTNAGLDMNQPWEFTADIQLHTSDTTSSYYHLFAFTPFDGASTNYRFRWNSGLRLDLAWGGFSNGTNAWRGVGTPLTLDTWHSITITFDGVDTFTYDVDGNTVSSTLAGVGTTAPSGMSIGRHSGYYPGFSLKNMRLTINDEVALYMPFYDGVGTTISDIAPSPTNGTAYNITEANFWVEQ